MNPIKTVTQIALVSLVLTGYANAATCQITTRDKVGKSWSQALMVQNAHDCMADAADKLCHETEPTLRHSTLFKDSFWTAETKFSVSESQKSALCEDRAKNPHHRLPCKITYSEYYKNYSIHIGDLYIETYRSYNSAAKAADLKAAEGRCYVE
ncbi:MAG: hypothetical protein AAB425_12670 [Bdellovibrionota bacterium]